MAWKRAKLLSNVGNALEVLLRNRHGMRQVHEGAKDEARPCFVAADLSLTSDDEYAARWPAATLRPGRRPRTQGGSTWQSICARQASVETDFLNGEIVRLGRRYGVPTPVNVRIQEGMRGRTDDGQPDPGRPARVSRLPAG